MTYAEATHILAALKREELRDRSFGDAEVYWLDPSVKRDEAEVAYGYFTTKDNTVTIKALNGREEAVFTGAVARLLRAFGASCKVEYNDNGGPSYDE